MVGGLLRHLLDPVALGALGGLLGRVVVFPVDVYRRREVGAEFLGEIVVAAATAAVVSVLAVVVVIVAVTRALAGRASRFLVVTRALTGRASGFFAADFESKVFELVPEAGLGEGVGERVGVGVGVGLGITFVELVVDVV